MSNKPAWAWKCELSVREHRNACGTVTGAKHKGVKEVEVRLGFSGG